MAAFKGRFASQKFIRFLKTVLIVFLLALGAGVFAREDHFNLGFLFNINACNTSGEYHDYWRSNGIIGVQLNSSTGVFVNRNLSNHSYGNIEFRYIRKGSNHMIKENWLGLSLYYIEVPVSYGYKFGTSTSYFLCEAGFACGWLAKSKVSTSDIRNTLLMDSTLLSSIRKADISMQIAVRKPLNPQYKNNLFLTFRFSHSIRSITNEYHLYNYNYGVQLDYIIRGKDYRK